MLLWVSSFDREALDEAQLTDGPWAEIGVGTTTLSSSSPTPRTGIGCLTFANNTGSIARRVFGSALTTVGVAFACYFDALPTTNARCSIELRDAANAANVTIVIQTTGAIAAYRGEANGTLLGTSTDLLTAAAWNHLEIKALASQTVGTVEVRLNGVTVLNLSGIDTVNGANVEFSQVAWRQRGSNGARWSIDDVFAWDTSGAVNNDFMGDLKAVVLMPNADTAEADWTKSTGSDGYALIDEIPASAADYIEAAVATDRSDFDFEDLPGTILSVSAVVMWAKALKTDAGTCDLRINAQSNGTTGAGTDRPLTTAATYYEQVFETNPDGGGPWSPSSVNAAEISFVRTA